MRRKSETVRFLSNAVLPSTAFHAASSVIRFCATLSSSNVSIKISCSIASGKRFVLSTSEGIFCNNLPRLENCCSDKTSPSAWPPVPSRTACPAVVVCSPFTICSSAPSRPSVKICPSDVVCPSAVICPPVTICPSAIVCPPAAICPSAVVCPPVKICPSAVVCPPVSICPSVLTSAPVAVCSGRRIERIL